MPKAPEHYIVKKYDVNWAHRRKISLWVLGITAIIDIVILIMTGAGIRQIGYAEYTKHASEFFGVVMPIFCLLSILINLTLLNRDKLDAMYATASSMMWIIVWTFDGCISLRCKIKKQREHMDYAFGKPYCYDRGSPALSIMRTYASWVMVVAFGVHFVLAARTWHTRGPKTPFMIAA